MHCFCTIHLSSNIRKKKTSVVFVTELMVLCVEGNAHTLGRALLVR